MSDLDDILIDLRDADTTFGELTALKKDLPRDEILDINREAIAKRRAALERELGEVLKREQTDLIEYRLRPRESDRSPVLGVARSISLFQEMVTAVFAGLQANTPRLVEPSAAELSALTFATSEKGAAYVSFSIPNERLMLARSDIEASLELVLELLQAQSPSVLRQIATRIGLEAIAKAYAWAENSVEYAFGISIRWRKAGEWDRVVDIPAQEAWLLRNIIEQTEDEYTERVERDCYLLGLDFVESTFRLEFSDGERIAGRLAEDFTSEKTLQLHGAYRAILTRTARISYSVSEERLDWLLRAISTRP